MPSARASTAACAVGPPDAVATPRHVEGSRPAVSAGARSSATRMPASRSVGRGASTPSRRASTSRPTLRRSAARARRYGSSSAVQPTAVASTASCHAAAAAAPSRIRRRVGSRSASSSRNSRCASKIAARARPARAATSSRCLAISARAPASASSSAASSSSFPRLARPSGTAISGVENRRAGPIATPGDAGRPCSTPSGCGLFPESHPAAGSAARGACGARSSGASSNRRSAS